MSKHNSKYVCLGTGVAGGYVAKAFVEKGVAPGELTLVGEDSTLPYERPALSKAFLFNSDTRLPGFHTAVGGGGARQDQDFYDKHGIQVIKNKKAESIDFDNKVVTLAGGDSITYEHLILATGAAVIKLPSPGGDLEGIHYLRSEPDAQALVDAIQKTKQAGSKALVIGGGYIGLEVAAGITKNDVKVTWAIPEPNVMARLMPPKVSEFYQKYYEDKGVELILNAGKVEAFKGENGKVKSVQLDDGTTLEADLVVVGIGAKPRLELFQDKLKVDQGGVLVDGHFQTSIPNVYAIGDIATFPLLTEGGKPTRTEHVAHARQSAQHVVSSILDPSTPEYDYLPFFYSREFELGWKFYGVQDGETHVVGDGDPFLAAFWVKEDRVNAAFLESKGDEKYTDTIQNIGRKRPRLSAGEVESLKAAKTAQQALELLDGVTSKSS